MENPTNSGFHSTAEGSTGVFTSVIYNILPFATYHVRAYATNSAGTAYGNDVSFIAPPFVIGQSYKGGIIFYLFPSGINGLVSGSNDVPVSPWGGSGINVVTSDSIGAGLNNTYFINAYCGTNSAGWACSVGVSGFGARFLPSKMELQLLYNQKNFIGGFINGIYWSSTQANVNEAFGIDFTSGEPVSDDKNAYHAVRAVWYINDL